MPKYTLNNSMDSAALVLPTKPRIVLDKGVTTEVPQEAHELLVNHKIIGQLITSGQISVVEEANEKPVKTTRTSQVKQEV